MFVLLNNLLCTCLQVFQTAFIFIAVLQSGLCMLLMVGYCCLCFLKLSCLVKVCKVPLGHQVLR